MNDSDNYDFLHQLAKRHYERAEFNITEYITSEIGNRIANKPANPSPIRLLDIGCGKKSTLLKALEKALQEVLPGIEVDIEIYLLDIVSFEGEIYGIDVSYPITGALNRHNFPGGASFKAKFIKADFNRELGTEKKDAEADGEYKSEIDRQFDVIVLNFSIHEILDSSDLEFTDENGKTKSLTTQMFLTLLFKKIHRLLADGAMVYFGDAYFPKYISSQQTKKILQHMDSNFGHADAPALFPHPEDIIKTIVQGEELKGKFELRLDTERLTEIGENTGLYRKSYFIGLKKSKDNEK